MSYPKDIPVDSWRVLTAVRVFVLAAALGLSGTTGDMSDGAPAFLALCVLAAVMSVPAPSSTWMAVSPLAEGALVALLLTSSGEAAAPLMLYLVVPPLVAGIQVGGKWPLTAVAAQLTAVVAAIVAGHQADRVETMLSATGPWMLAGLGLGFVGSWAKPHIGESGGDQAGYESAHRLLGQLRQVSRRLSTGLDVSALAEQMLAHTLEVLDGRRAQLLVRTDGTKLTPLAGAGVPFSEQLEHDPFVNASQQDEKPQRSWVDDADEHVRHRTVVPLRVGTRMIGAVVTDGPTGVDNAALSRLRRYLDEHSLRLETALLFDEVRSTATLEERHRLAREIHDGIAQEIASLGYLVDDLAACASTPEAREAAGSLRRELSRVVSELRLSIFDLRSTVSAHAGLGLALSDYAREVGKRAGMTVHLALSEHTQRLHVNVETELLRIAQEAITNARKHSRATNLWVSLDTESPIVMMRIEDDGVGSATPRDDHFGLRIMQERAKRIGGEVAITPRRHGGTSVVVTVWPRNTTLTGARDDDLSSTG